MGKIRAQKTISYASIIGQYDQSVRILIQPAQRENFFLGLDDISDTPLSALRTVSDDAARLIVGQIDEIGLGFGFDLVASLDHLPRFRQSPVYENLAGLKQAIRLFAAANLVQGQIFIDYYGEIHVFKITPKDKNGKKDPSHDESDDEGHGFIG